MNEEITLYELNMVVGAAISEALPGRYRVAAEISELRDNASGHCYMELVQKDAAGQTVAKARANIWASTYRNLRPYFEKATGERLRAGIKVLVTVSVTFHPTFHYSLTVLDIDPTYTIGDMARRRAEIIRRLTEEGIIEDNKKLEWNTLPRRVAVISSASAAGYGDFMNQLHGNCTGYKFYTSLFAAIMQGEQSENSIIGALERIYGHAGDFDCVVIIRGGGATSELNCFDSYMLAQHVAQFPLPVIVGIGHDRDETVLDYVANTRVKTPTAAAEWLVGRMMKAEEYYAALQESIMLTVNERITREKEYIALLGERIPAAVTQRLAKEENRLLQIRNKTSYCAQQYVMRERLRINGFSSAVRSAVERNVEREKGKLQLIASKIELTSPEYILKRGYSITVKDGYPVKSAAEITDGDSIHIVFADGEATAVVNGVIKTD